MMYLLDIDRLYEAHGLIYDHMSPKMMQISAGTCAK